MAIDLTPNKPPSSGFARIFFGIFRQKSKSHRCPSEPRLDGKRVLITGGAAGLGEFVTRGLIERGAKVTSLARGVSKGTGSIAGVELVRADLADIDSIVEAVDSLGNRRFDILICNAGILSPQAEITRSGLERTFAVNVLGHHLLYRLLIEKNKLTSKAKIVMTTGDIYRTQDRCSAFLPFGSTVESYSRSKLGNLWQVRELAKNYPDLHPIAIHPGVVASGFSGSKKGIGGWLRDRLLLSERLGAQAALIAATQDLPRGSYWHNVYGIMSLPDGDPAQQRQRSEALWDQLESLTDHITKELSATHNTQAEGAPA